MTQRYLQKKAAILKALSDPTRLSIIDLLKDGERCVCEIYPAIDQEQPNVSKHLNQMKRAGILDSRKDGLRTLYWIKNADVLEILRYTDAILQREFEEDRMAFITP